jgi:hypothetical protein
VFWAKDSFQATVSNQAQRPNFSHWAAAGECYTFAAIWAKQVASPDQIKKSKERSKMRMAKISITLLAVVGLLMVTHDTVKAGGRPESARPATTTTYTGNIDATFTITIASTGLPTTKIACVVQTTVDDPAGTYKELSEVLAKVSGTTGTCTVNLPYSWPLEDGSTDTVSIEYDVVAPDTLPTGNVAPGRYTRRIVSIPMPANGATTDETVDITF